jgi:hypothetical protein
MSGRTSDQPFVGKTAPTQIQADAASTTATSAAAMTVKSRTTGARRPAGSAAGSSGCAARATSCCTPDSALTSRYSADQKTANEA